MYNNIDDKFLGSKSLSTLSLVTKSLNPFVKGRFDISNFSELPVIKEEKGHSSEEESEISVKNEKYVKSYTKLPPLNINCLMNINVKQSHSIWNTTFGKRLINEIGDCEVLNEPDIKERGKKISKKCKSFSKTNFVKEFNDKNVKEDKVKFNEIENTRKKTKRVYKKKNQTAVEKTTGECKKPLKTISKTKETEKFPEISKKLTFEDSSTSSLDSRPQQYLTEYVRSIFDNYCDQFKCEHCNEIFSNNKELFIHQKQHEIEKETCLLCEKVFYNSNEFVLHLLTHEGVDRFSCRKCKKYFPNLRKFKQHQQDFHYKPPATFSCISPPKLEFVEKWLPKFECKRCKIKFDSVQTYEAHRRIHVKKDLARAYLLNLKNI